MIDTPTPRTDAAEIVQIFVNHPELRTNRVPVDFARQLERELAEVTQSLAFQKQLNREVIEREKQTHAELAETNNDYRCLAELLDGHDATECRANLVKLKADLAAERALADRLARELESWSRIAGDYTPMDADKALAAWKEARRE